MNFYRRRPLALIITICVSAAVAVFFLPAYLKVAFIALTALAAPITAWLLKRRGVTSVCNMSATAFVIISAAFIMVLILISFAYFNVYASRYGELSHANIEATVTSVESRTAYGAVYEVRMSERDGKAERAKGRISTDIATQFNVGDVVEADIAFCRLEDFYSYREVSRFETVADGIVFTASVVGEAKLYGEDNGIFILLARLREKISAKLSLYLDKESAPLADALFLGKREGLGKLERDFRYIGAMHLLALSGLHLSVTTLGVERLLMRLGIGVKVRYTLTILLAFFYVALTGFIASALRAAIMLTLAYTAALLDTESDRVTSLFAAVGLIVLFDPTAIFDVSLQLSFAATLGLLLVSEPIEQIFGRYAPSAKSHPILRRLAKIACEAAASLGAIMFVLPLQWFYFGEVSLMSVVSTLVLTPICEALLILMLPFLVSSLLGAHFAAGALGGAVRALSEVCADTAAALSERSLLVSLGYPFVLPIMMICVAVIVYMAVRGCRSWLYALAAFGVSVLIFLGGVLVYDTVYSARVSIDVASCTSSDAITLVSGRSAAAIFVGDGSSQTVFMTLDFLYERNLTEIEALVLTSVSRRNVNSVRRLLNLLKVETVLLPAPKDEYTAYLCSDIAELAAEYGSRLVFYDNSDTVELLHGDVTVNIAKPAYLERSASALTAITFEFGDTAAAYVGASAWEDAETWELVNGARYIVFGSCGPVIKGAPKGVVQESTAVVCLSDSSLAAVLAPWLEGFDGTVIAGGRLSLGVKP